eukprot:TRINITY_DN3015_c0_g1_i1.p1 TRINITY_DN3015_c0_g1~~TRINITY_DN3015_c0_g1_i1.p1  ORF type:complete len:901 (-),score=-7.32 TRINITY_DN3015_c0_g1_i1:1100-3523(-)
MSAPPALVVLRSASLSDASPFGLFDTTWDSESGGDGSSGDELPADGPCGDSCRSPCAVDGGCSGCLQCINRRTDSCELSLPPPLPLKKTHPAGRDQVVSHQYPLASFPKGPSVAPSSSLADATGGAPRPEFNLGTLAAAVFPVGPEVTTGNSDNVGAAAAGEFFYECDDTWMGAEGATWMNVDDQATALNQFLDSLPSIPDAPAAGHQAPAAPCAPSNGAASESHRGDVETCDWMEGFPPLPVQLDDAHDVTLSQAVPPPPVSVVATASHGASDTAPDAGNLVKPAGPVTATPNCPPQTLTPISLLTRGVWWTPEGSASVAGRKRSREECAAASARDPASEPSLPLPLPPQQQSPFVPAATSTPSAVDFAVAVPPDAPAGRRPSSPAARACSRSNSSSGGSSDSRGESRASGTSKITSSGTRGEGSLVGALRRCLETHAATQRAPAAGGSVLQAAGRPATVKDRPSPSPSAATSGVKAPASRTGAEAETAAVGIGPAAAIGGIAAAAATAGDDASRRSEHQRAGVACVSLADRKPAGVGCAVAASPRHADGVGNGTLHAAQVAPHYAQPATVTVAPPLASPPTLPFPPAPAPAPPPKACLLPAAAAAYAAACATLPPFPAASSVRDGGEGGATSSGGGGGMGGTEGEGEGEGEGGEWAHEDGGEEDEEQKRRKRLMRNRQSALLSRQRRKSYVSELEGRCAALQATIGQLRQVVAVTALENGALRDELARLHAMWTAPAPAGAAAAAVVGVAGGGGGDVVEAEGTSGGRKEDGKAVVGGDARCDVAEPAVLESGECCGALCCAVRGK